MHCSNEVRTSLRWLALAGALLLLFVPVGCGDDDDSGGSGGQLPGDTSYQDLLDEEITSMGEVAGSAAGAGGLNILFHEDVSPIFGELLPDLGGFLGKVAPVPTTQDVLRGMARVPLTVQQEAKAAPDIANWYGTYEYMLFEEAGEDPFFRWVLVDAFTPDDGFIFRIGEGDGFLDDDGETEMEGELRYLHIEIDEGLPEDPDDDILTDILFELAVQPVGSGGELPTVVRVPFTMELDGDRVPTLIQIGDPEASSPADDGAAFLGPLLFHLGLGFDGTDLEAAFQLYDSVSSYALQLALEATGIDMEAQTIETVTFSFGFGETPNPATPPWVLSITFSDFEQDEVTGDQLANVSGSITYHGAVAATLAGDTSSVPFDWDGDGTAVEGEECVNVQITFADRPGEPMSICAAFDELGMLFDLFGAAATMIATH